MTPIEFIATTLLGTLPIPAVIDARRFQCADKAPRPVSAIRKPKARPYKRAEGTKPHLTRKQIAEIVARREAGEHKGDIAKRFNIHPRTVTRYFKLMTKE